MAGTGDDDAVVIADRAGGAVGADGSANTLANNLAAAHNHRRRAAAGTGGAD